MAGEEQERTRQSGETRQALGVLVDRSRQGVDDAQLTQVSDRLTEVGSRIDGVVASLPNSMRERVAGLQQTGVQAERLREILLAEVSLTIRDFGNALSDRAERFEAKFGNLVAAEEIQALISQTDTTSSYLTTSSADSATLTHIDDYGKFLNDWWHIAVLPTADLLTRATTRTTEVVVGTRVSTSLGMVLEEARSRRAEEVSRELETTLESVKRATSAAGEVELTKAFDKVREQAVSGARLWTTAVFICVAVGIALPVAAIWNEPSTLAQLKDEAGVVVKALMGLPLFGLAAYSGRIAGQHRETSRHLTVLIAQLKSVQAYANELPPEQRLTLMSKLGDRAFADPGFVLKENDLSLVPKGVTQALRQTIGRVPGPQG